VDAAAAGSTRHGGRVLDPGRCRVWQLEWAQFDVEHYDLGRRDDLGSDHDNIGSYHDDIGPDDHDDADDDQRPGVHRFVHRSKHALHSAAVRSGVMHVRGVCDRRNRHVRLLVDLRRPHRLNGSTRGSLREAGPWLRPLSRISEFQCGGDAEDHQWRDDDHCGAHRRCDYASERSLRHIEPRRTRT
jgi:hypothetical protein